MNLFGLTLTLAISAALMCSTEAKWWFLGAAYGTAQEPVEIPCKGIPNISTKQVRFCLKNQDKMPTVAEGAHQGIQECQHQFRGRRWNCTTIDGDQSVFGRVLERGSRETAFVNAILAAGVTHAVTRACSRGDYLECGCDRTHRGPPGGRTGIVPNATWRWGGCSEEVWYSMELTKDFLKPTGEKRARTKMDRHNTDAGRNAVLHNMELRCKCHGVSGSCELKTCWWEMAPFRKLGDTLKTKYDMAAEMAVERQRKGRTFVEELAPRYDDFKEPTSNDLIYYDQSPDFCTYDPEVGSFGTQGRECNRTSHGIDGCELLCCGRGHNTMTVVRRERCDCVFVWCCKVVCKECVRVIDVHTCK
uniref:Protein Wnt n=1 Tax=Paracentrotus lividus TaxID=7656 RepID=A0A023VZ56_PARLI|nr:Wnt3 [Paracentrotus lividus]